MQRQRSAIVTGGSSGIGFAIAAMLVTEGFDVTIAARDTERVEEACAALGAVGRQTDVTREEDCAGVVRDHLARAGGVDVLVNAAGSSQYGRIENTTPDAWTEQMDVNLRGVFMMTRESLPALRERGGLVVGVASPAARGRTAGLAAYGASKAAIFTLMRTVTAENERFGVRATTLAPGFVDTPMTQSATKSPLRPAEMIRPEDCAACVRLLLCLSPQAHVAEITIDNFRSER